MICLDIETLPTSDPSVIAEIAAGITHPKNMSKADTIAHWEQDDKPGLVTDAIERTALDGTYGSICCLGVAVDDEPAQAHCSADEKSLLMKLSTYVTKATQLYQHTFVGHNIASFDLRFLWQRYVILGIRPPSSIPFNARPWDKSIADTMLLWNPDRERRISLDQLCKALGVQTSKGDLDGSKVADAFAAGEYQRIETYCAADVNATRACYRKMVWA